MKIKPVLLVFSFLFVRCAAQAFDVESFLVRSIGGPLAFERIKTLNSYRMTGAMNWNGLNGKYQALFKAPDKIKVTAEFGTFSIVQGFDGSCAWQKDMHGRVFDLAGFEKTEFMRSVYFMTFAYVIPDRLPGRYRAAEIMDSDSAYPVNIYYFPFLNDQVRVQFDAKTCLPDFQFALFDNLVVETKLDDYRKVEGVLLPFHSLSTAPGTPIMTEITLDSVAFDNDVGDSEFVKSIVHLDDFDFPADSASITIPFKFSNGHVLVYVEVNGVKKGWFILDTGASATYYDAKFVNSLGLNPIGELPSMGLGGFEKIQIVQVDSLNMGHLTLYNQTAGVLPLDQLTTQVQKKTTFGGLLGYDFFMRFPVRFDFKEEKMTVYNPNNFNLPESGVSYPFHLSMMIPTISAQLNGVSGNFIIDLGNALGLIIHPKFSEKLTGQSTIDTSNTAGRSIAGIGAGVAGRYINVGSLQIGAHKLNIPEAILAESSDGLTGSWEIAGNIGTKVLEQYDILFDFPNSRIVFYNFPVSDK